MHSRFKAKIFKLLSKIAVVITPSPSIHLLFISKNCHLPAISSMMVNGTDDHFFPFNRMKKYIIVPNNNTNATIINACICFR